MVMGKKCQVNLYIAVSGLQPAWLLGFGLVSLVK